MGTIYDRRTGAVLGRLDAEETRRLRALLESQDPDDDAAGVDPQLLENLPESGASPAFLAIVRQILEGREDLDVSFTKPRRSA